MHNTGGHSYEAKVRLLDDRDNGLDILQLAYMDHTMGMVIMLPRVKTNTWQATKSWRPRNLLAATPLGQNQTDAIAKLQKLCFWVRGCWSDCKIEF